MEGINENIRIAAYTRISVDDELDRENTSIENQKAIISDYVKTKFPGSLLTFFEDRDMSGYTFLQRPAYQQMKSLLLGGEYSILIVKDFSRFGRRNSFGLMELETLRDSGVRVISIGDGIDYPTNNDWLMIQFRFLMNEIPVTETSKKIKDVIRRRQRDAQWVCNCPYGYYLHPTHKNEICVDEEGAETVRMIFKLYNSGWGYKKISNYLTEHGYPTALALMKKHVEQKGGDSSRIKPSPVWSHVTISKIVKNDFYIGTFRQNMWTRSGINKKDVRVSEDKHLVFEDHHEPIIDRETFEKAQETAKKRTRNNYRGVRKYAIPYSGVLFCADCGSPMFSHSQPSRPPGYVCGAYHRFGLKGCTSHHIHEAKLDIAIRSYISRVRDTLAEALVNLDMEKTKLQAESNKKSAKGLEGRIEEIKLQLKEAAKQRLRQITQKPQEEELINETFDEIEKDYRDEISKLKTRIKYLAEEAEKKAEIKENINQVLTTFDTLLAKEKFTKSDIGMIVEKITVDSEKDITVELRSDISELLEMTREPTV